MRAKRTISLPVDAQAAIDAIERLARRDCITIGMAAAILIERGADRLRHADTPSS